MVSIELLDEHLMVYGTVTTQKGWFAVSNMVANRVAIQMVTVL